MLLALAWTWHFRRATMQNIYLFLASLFFTFSVSTSAHAASIAIIVHPDNNTNFDERIARQIFLGQVKSFPDGKEAVPYANAGDAELHEEFISKVLKRNPNTMNAYWARMIFTAKANPPRELPDSHTVKKIVASSVNSIAYIHPDDVDETVRVIAIVD